MHACGSVHVHIRENGGTCDAKLWIVSITASTTYGTRPLADAQFGPRFAGYLRRVRHQTSQTCPADSSCA